MKSCILLSGQIRDAEKWFPSIKKNLIDVYDADVFISTWIPDLSIETNTSIEKLVELYKPIGLEIENFEETKYDLTRIIESVNFIYPPETKPLNVLSMYYKIMKANNLKKLHEINYNFNYDVVIRSRMDLHFVHECSYLIPNEETILIPKGWDWRNGLNDLFAIGGTDAMNYYSDLFLNFEKIISETGWLHPESLLKHHLQKQNYNIYRPEIKITFDGKSLWEY